MKLEKLERIRTLKRQSGDLKSFFARFRDETSNPSCDKYEAAFSEGNSFENWRATVYWKSYTGYYGSSSCSRSGPSLDAADAQNYLIRAMNKHAELIFETMAKLMEADAAKMRADAEEEIRKASDLLASLDEAAESDSPATA